ncbi:MAG: hypothetical protein Q4C00_03930 [Bacillota bacterium]|nr:hypothetical protein [Bacillota bacterium]
MKKFLSIIMILAAVLVLSLPIAADEGAEGDNPDSGGSALPSGNSLSPNLVVSSFGVGGDTVTAGKEFTLTYNLYNTNKYISVQNLMVKISGGEIFSLAKETDTYYIEKIKAKGAAERSARFVTSVETAPGSYPVTLSLTYEYYDDGIKYTGSSHLSISIPVAQDDRVSIIKAAVGGDEEPVYVNEEYGVEYDFINTGFTKMLNTELLLYNEENGDCITSAYLGTVNPSVEMSGSSYLYVTFGSTGEKNLKLIVSYEDQNLNTYTTERVFTVNVQEPPPPVVEEETAGENSFLLWGILLIAAIILALVLFIILRRRRKRRKAEEELWDDEDDLIDEAEDDGKELPENMTEDQEGEEDEVH